MMDVYALHVLSHTIGTDRQAIGDGLSERLIANACEQCLYEFARASLDAIAGACFAEIANACDRYLVNPARLRSWLVYEGTQQIRNGFRVIHDNDKKSDKASIGQYELTAMDWKAFYREVGGWPSVIRIFRARLWSEADLYGGERWATIATQAMDLLNQIKRGGPPKVMRAVDRVLGLQHNTGTLFTKSSLGDMVIGQSVLEKRTSLLSIPDIEPLVSAQVARFLRIASRKFDSEFDKEFGLAHIRLRVLSEPPKTPILG